jgi:hypothetical protein
VLYEGDEEDECVIKLRELITFFTEGFNFGLFFSRHINFATLLQCTKVLAPSVITSK